MSKRWAYQDENGEPVMVVVRLDTADDDKKFEPVDLFDTGGSLPLVNGFHRYHACDTGNRSPWIA